MSLTSALVYEKVFVGRLLGDARGDARGDAHETAFRARVVPRCSIDDAKWRPEGCVCEQQYLSTEKNTIARRRRKVPA